VVVGPSGSGKSSLLRAGLLPALSRGALAPPGSRDWLQFLFRPTAHPLHALAAAVAAGDDAGELLANPPRLRAAVRARAVEGMPGELRAVVVVDQFEETFTLCADESERGQFVRALCELATGDRESPPAALVVLGLRADFYGHCAVYPELAAALERGPVVVGSMTGDELSAAIRRPAESSGLRIESALVELVLRDLNVDDHTGHDPGALPLLSHALVGTWQQREGRTLTVSGYRSTGGIRGAVAKSAERMFVRLDPAGQAAVRQLLLSLVQLGTGGQRSRRRAERASLLRELSDPAVPRALEALVRARLLTLDEATVEITHEALIDAWPRLRRWIDEDRAGLLVWQKVAAAARLWDQRGREAAALLRGSRLVAARGLASASSLHGVVTPLAREFLQASVGEEQRERSAARRRARRGALFTVALASMLALSLVAGGLVVAQRQEAVGQRDRALSSQLGAQADRLRELDPSVAMQLSLAAYRIADTPEARGSLLSSLASPLGTRLVGHVENVTGVAFSHDGRMLASGAQDHTVRLWDLSNPNRPAPLGTPLPGHVGGRIDFPNLAISSDDRMLADVDEGSHLRLWDIANRARPQLIKEPGIGLVVSLAFGGPGHTLAAGAVGDIRMWDLTDPHRPSPLGPPLVLPGGETLPLVALSSDGRELAAAENQAIRLWDVSDPRSPIPISPPSSPSAPVRSLAFSLHGTLAVGMTALGAGESVRLWRITARSARDLGSLVSTDRFQALSAAFSPDGGILATGDQTRTVRFWDVATRRQSASVMQPKSSGPLAFSPDGRLLAGGGDPAVRIWRLPTPALTLHTGAVGAVAFSPDGRRLATGGANGEVRLWDSTGALGPFPLGQPLTGHEDIVEAVAFSPDGHTLATGSLDGTTRLWHVSDEGRAQGMGLPLTTAPVFAVAFSPDGRTLAVADGSVHLLDVADPLHPQKLGAPLVGAGRIYSVAFSPDGLTLATGDDRIVHLWNVSVPAQASARGGPLTGHAGPINRLAFAPNGRTLATASDDRSVRLWDVSNPDHATAVGPPLSGQGGAILSVAISADGRTLAAGSGDHTVWLWSVSDVHHPAPLAILTGHGDAVNAVAFSPRADRAGSTSKPGSAEKGRLVTGSDDRTVRLWDLDAEAVARRVCEVAGPPLSRAEWQQYVPEMPYQPPCA
jgi:WD40 repeat protein